MWKFDEHGDWESKGVVVTGQPSNLVVHCKALKATEEQTTITFNF
jgi:hypothetical protein